MEAVSPVEVNTDAGRFLISRRGNALGCQVLGPDGLKEIAYWNQIPLSARSIVWQAVEDLCSRPSMPAIDPTKLGFTYEIRT